MVRAASFGIVHNKVQIQAVGRASMCVKYLLLAVFRKKKRLVLDVILVSNLRLCHICSLETDLRQQWAYTKYKLQLNHWFVEHVRLSKGIILYICTLSRWLKLESNLAWFAFFTLFSYKEHIAA